MTLAALDRASGRLPALWPALASGPLEGPCGLDCAASLSTGPGVSAPLLCNSLPKPLTLVTAIRSEVEPATVPGAETSCPLVLPGPEGDADKLELSSAEGTLLVQGVFASPSGDASALVDVDTAFVHADVGRE